MGGVSLLIVIACIHSMHSRLAVYNLALLEAQAHSL